MQIPFCHCPILAFTNILNFLVCQNCASAIFTNASNILQQFLPTTSVPQCFFTMQCKLGLYVRCYKALIPIFCTDFCYKIHHSTIGNAGCLVRSIWSCRRFLYPERISKNKMESGKICLLDFHKKSKQDFARLNYQWVTQAHKEQ